MSSKSIDLLQELQAVESKLRGLRSQLRRRERIVHQQQLKLKQCDEKIQSKHREIQNIKLKLAELELELKSKEAEISKLQSQLNTAKSNKEYSTFLTQLNTARADSSKIEDQILKMLSEIDEMKTLLSEAENQKKEAEKELEAKRIEYERYKDELQKEIDATESELKELETRIDPEILDIFKRVADRHDGEVLAEIIANDPKKQEFICSGCYMSVPLEIVNALLTKPDELQLCNACGRILYVKQQTVSNNKEGNKKGLVDA